MNTRDYEKRRKAYIEYMYCNIHAGDWHAVSDAANDLRVLEAEFHHQTRIPVLLRSDPESK